MLIFVFLLILKLSFSSRANFRSFQRLHSQFLLGPDQKVYTTLCAKLVICSPISRRLEIIIWVCAEQLLLDEECSMLISPICWTISTFTRSQNCNLRHLSDWTFHCTVSVPTRSPMPNRYSAKAVACLHGTTMPGSQSASSYSVDTKVLGYGCQQ